MKNWMLLEAELTDLIGRSLPDHDTIIELDNGDKAVGRYHLGTAYEVLNITLLARELDACGVHTSAQALEETTMGVSRHSKPISLDDIRNMVEGRVK